MAAHKKKKRKTRQPECQRFRLAVTAASATVDCIGPKIYKPEPDGCASSNITIEGTLDRPAMRDVRVAVLTVFAKDQRAGNPGAAIGGTDAWRVAAHLPPPQFAHLLAVVLADKLCSVDLLFDNVKRGCGILRNVSFNTAPVPCEAQYEDDVEE